MVEERGEIVIVGGGVCGLALALALHRKGVQSLVLERSKTLRSYGVGIVILANGWRALDHLGVGSKLRLTSPIAHHGVTDIDLDSGKQTTSVIGEVRSVRRGDLINVLAEELPHGCIRFESKVVSVRRHPLTSLPILKLSDGSTIRSKVLIGCDGTNSIVADFLGLKPKKVFATSTVRGFTSYPKGHGLPSQFVRVKQSGGAAFGRGPIDDKLVFWFIGHKSYPKDPKVALKPELVKKFSLDCLKDFPKEMVKTVEQCDLTSLSLTHLRQRAPWDVLIETFRSRTVTVAGDAMHVMAPFLGQGGSAGLEDAVVLARCLTRKMTQGKKSEESIKEIEEAIDEYVEERRMRLVWLSAQTYLIGSMLETSSGVTKFAAILVLLVLFKDTFWHCRYDCGSL